MSMHGVTGDSGKKGLRSDCAHTPLIYYFNLMIAKRQDIHRACDECRNAEMQFHVV